MTLRPTLPYYVSTAALDIITFSFFAIVLVSTVVRLIFRKYVVPKPGMDDIYIIFSLLFGLAFIIVMHFESYAYENVYDTLAPLSEATQDNFAYAYNRYTLKQFAIALNLSFYDNFTQTISVTLAKMAFVSFYRRLTKLRSHHIVLRCIDGILVINCVSNCLVFIWTTSPVDCFFHIDKFNGGAECQWNIDPIAAVIASCAVQIVVDLLLAGLPWIILWKMKIGVTDKLKLVFIYSVGLTSMACSAARMWSLDVASLRFMDVLTSQFIFTFTTMLEAFAAILCANIPILVGGFLRLKKKSLDRDRIYNYDRSDSSRTGMSGPYSSRDPSSRNNSLRKEMYDEYDDDYDVESPPSKFTWS